MLDKGSMYRFFYPVVPHGTAPRPRPSERRAFRVQMEFAVKAFRRNERRMKSVELSLALHIRDYRSSTPSLAKNANNRRVWL